MDSPRPSIAFGQLEVQQQEAARTVVLAEDEAAVSAIEGGGAAGARPAQPKGLGQLGSRPQWLAAAAFHGRARSARTAGLGVVRGSWGWSSRRARGARPHGVRGQWGRRGRRAAGLPLGRAAARAALATQRLSPPAG